MIARAVSPAELVLIVAGSVLLVAVLMAAAFEAGGAAHRSWSRGRR